MLMMCGTISAQKFTYVPYTANGYMTGYAISPNGRYVAGSDKGGQAFIADMESDSIKIKYFASPLLLDTLESAGNVDAAVNSVSDSGVGVGYLEESATRFDFATGTYTVLCNDLSAIKYASQDSSFMCGYAYGDSWVTQPYWWHNGVMKQLPQPAKRRLAFDFNGASVVDASENGETIIGYLNDDMSTYPLVVWHRDAGDSTYSVDPVCRKMFDSSWYFDGTEPYSYFEGAAISANGKWIAINYADKVFGNPYAEMFVKFARYDVEADTLQILDCPGASVEKYYWSNGITNDGTIVGYYEDASGSRIGVICQSGETEVKTMATAFPGIKELAEMDDNQLNTPCAITPDGRYIAGFGYANLSETDVCFATWRLDTQAISSSVEALPSTTAANNKVIGIFSIDGKRVNNNKKGRLLIEKFANGNVRKVLRGAF